MQNKASRIDNAYNRTSGSRGLALVTVLWVLMLLALIAASFTRTTRTEVNLTRNLIENAEAEALADAGAVFVREAVVENFVARAIRLYEQDRKEPYGPSRLGMYVRRWLGWART